MRPRILLIGGTYRALCVLERLLERGERVVGFLGQEGETERDFCAEILEICDRASIPARSGRKLGEEMVRWLEDRIRPELAIGVGLSSEIPLALGGNCRLGLLEVVDLFQSAACPGIALRQRGQSLVEKRIEPPRSPAEREDVFLQVVEGILSMLDEYLGQLEASHSGADRGVRFDPEGPTLAEIESVRARPGPGPEVEALEAEVARYLQAENVVAVRSTEEAARVLLGAIGVGEGDEVILPGIASLGFAEAIRAAGATAVRADVEPDRLTPDPAQCLAAIGPKCHALVVSHPLGQAAPLDLLYAIAEERGLELLEDGAASFGARCGGSRLGRSPCTCVFHFPVRPGAEDPAVTLVTLSPALAERAGGALRALRIGDGLAALARATLSRWEDMLSARREIAAEYSSAFLRYDAFRLPPTPQDAIPTYAAFLLRLTRFARTGADDLAKLLAESGIEVRRLLAPGTERELGRLPVAEEALTRGILLPTRPDLTREERERTLDAIFDFAIG